jgi:hypothetical protein
MLESKIYRVPGIVMVRKERRVPAGLYLSTGAASEAHQSQQGLLEVESRDKHLRIFVIDQLAFGSGKRRGFERIRP